MSNLRQTQKLSKHLIYKSFKSCKELFGEKFTVFTFNLAYLNSKDSLVTVFEHNDHFLICIDGKFSYEVTFPNQLFKKHLQDRCLLNSNESHKYKLCLDDPYYNYGG